ncbi:arginine deiminase family protein [Sphingobacterium sp. E70]|uniref:arginine deiminase family protein n=1 Tax=Sphingobacterium sp. E70 TaxID=2853439 RepID=UPI00211D084E|nr:arginine deiminase family protein [Sphingobacterium sp. E70]ULT22990.1 arginine deiminase family protein [Sphingobacterium sp. E70]
MLRPRLLTNLEKEVGADDGYANFFVRDPFFTVGNAVIEGSLRFLQRTNEILPIRDIFEQQVYPDDCLYVAAPKPAIHDHGDLSRWHGPFIEGGDVLVLGKQVFVGNSGLASNSLGIRWLSKLLKSYGYQVEEIRLHPDILHLDCALGLIREGLMVVCEDAFLDGIPEHLKQWDKINVTLSEAGQLATNGLPINPMFTSLTLYLNLLAISFRFTGYMSNMLTSRSAEVLVAHSAVVRNPYCDDFKLMIFFRTALLRP